METVINNKGINVNVGIDNSDIILLASAIFVAVTLGAIIAGLIVKNA